MSIYIARSQNRGHERVNLYKFPTDDVFMISMSSIDDSLFIKKDTSSNEWRITYPFDRKTNDKYLQKLLQDISTLQRMKKPLTKDQNRYDYYKVNIAKGHRLILFDIEGGILDDSYFGIADLQNYGTVRGAADYTVYEISENIFNDIIPTPSLWRDNTIIKFDNAKADSIKISHTEHSFTLFQKQNTWVYKAKEGIMLLNNLDPAFSRLMSQLSNMSTSSFIDDAWEQHAESFSYPLLEMFVYHNDGKVDRLAFIKKDDRSVIVKVNEQTDILYTCLMGVYNRFALTSKDFEDIFSYSL
ncbi:MAG: DUF4340 domain-containing protein [Candidatus Cloacimonetes bacterium]|nr:DUF4340 domain-containing protein [Candidatus Cloacimonadota bacterium]